MRLLLLLLIFVSYVQAQEVCPPGTTPAQQSGMDESGVSRHVCISTDSFGHQTYSLGSPTLEVQNNNTTAFMNQCRGAGKSEEECLNLSQGDATTNNSAGPNPFAASENTRSERTGTLDWCKKADNKNDKSCEKFRTAFTACEDSYTRANRACTAQEISPTISSSLTAFTQLKASGNIKDACNKAKDLSLVSLGANAGFAVACNRFAADCERQCASNNDYLYGSSAEMPPSQMLRECKNFKQNYIAGVSQAIQDASSYAQSKACAEAADAKCVGQNAVNDPDCVQFCSQPGRESHPKCALAGASCQNPTFAQQNAQFCQCLQNPFGPNCSTAQFPTRPGNNGNDPLAGLRTNVGGLGDGENDFLGNESRGGSNSGAGGPNGGGSGFSGGAGASSPIAGDGGGEGSGDEPLNKDILTGSGGGGGGAGGFFGYGGGGGEGSAGGGRGGSGSSDGGSGIDLRAFLPGGKNDPRRGPASLEEASGITKSDGLTNFQKVTRKINQKLVEGDLNP